MAIGPILSLLDVQGVTTSQNGEKFDISGQKEFVAELRATEVVAGTSLDVKLQDSFDGGLTWNDWATFQQLTTTGAEVVQPSRLPGGDIRAVATVNGGTWDIRVSLKSNYAY